MFGFSRKPENRRLKREEVLDVKLRSSQVRATRLRLISGILAFASAVVLALFLVYRGGEWLLNRFVLENESFAIKRIEVQNEGTTPPEQIRKWAGVKEKDNLLALDLSRVKRDLELVPSIQSAAVERVLPDVLKLYVVEREPIARVYTMQPMGGTNGYRPVVYHLDAKGYVMVHSVLRRNETSSQPEWLPAITGVNPADFRPGRRADSVQVQAALRLIEAFEDSNMAGLVDIQHIDVSAPDVLRVKTGQGNDVTFSLNNLDWQLRRWRTVHDLALGMGKSIGTLDLSVSNNVPANFVGLIATPPVKAKPAKAVRTKKRNV